MRYLVISDIHANLEALDAVLADAHRTGFDEVLVLGDLVGYGADPNAVVDTVRALGPRVVVRGNHDKAACGLEPADRFNAAARQAADWTLRALSADNRAYLRRLPAGPLAVDAFCEVCHGSPNDEDEYVLEPFEALQALRGRTRPLCLNGHTHVPAAYWTSADAFDLVVPDAAAATSVAIESGRLYLVNPGSVGQPRDGDPRAAYAVVDSRASTVTLYRVEYDVVATQQKIVRAGLPDGLARRLALGK